MRVVTALPIASPDEDPLDPERILRELPERERADFLRAYRDAVAGAQDPAGWKNLQRTLRIWRGLVIAANRPGFYEAQDLAVARTGAGMPLEDAVRLYRRGA
jgi:hypothetical protein